MTLVGMWGWVILIFHAEIPGGGSCLANFTCHVLQISWASHKWPEVPRREYAENFAPIGPSWALAQLQTPVPKLPGVWYMRLGAVWGGFWVGVGEG